MKRLHVVRRFHQRRLQGATPAWRSSKAYYASSTNTTGKRRICGKPAADDSTSNWGLRKAELLAKHDRDL